jgi:hypothetical protein
MPPGRLSGVAHGVCFEPQHSAAASATSREQQPRCDAQRARTQQRDEPRAAAAAASATRQRHPPGPPCRSPGHPAVPGPGRAVEALGAPACAPLPGNPPQGLGAGLEGRGVPGAGPARAAVPGPAGVTRPGPARAAITRPSASSSPRRAPRAEHSVKTESAGTAQEKATGRASFPRAGAGTPRTGGHGATKMALSENRRGDSFLRAASAWRSFPVESVVQQRAAA